MFTFIIPSIRKDTLEYTIESVLAQTDPNWKAIVCGDGVCIPPFTDERILTIIAPKTNQSFTRNYAAKYANTEWLVMLDDDDWVVPEYLEWFKPYTENSDIIVSQMNNYGNIIPIGPIIEHGQIGISFAVRRSVLLEFPFPSVASEDYVYLKTARDEAGYRISFTNMCGYYVRKFLTDPNFIPTPL